jgi:hypothetical protein
MSLFSVVQVLAAVAFQSQLGEQDLFGLRFKHAGVSICAVARSAAMQRSYSCGTHALPSLHLSVLLSGGCCSRQPGSCASDVFGFVGTGV